MKKNYILLALIFLFSKTDLFAQALSVSATQVAGTCIADAQINATGSGGSAPYQYRLTAGPAGLTYPTPYGGSHFSGLKAGTYTVQVLDNLGTTATTNVTVTTSYVNLTLTSGTIISNTCPVTPNGIVNLISTGGKAPYSYSLLQGATVKYGPQSSTVFSGVADGTYTAQVQDGCGEIRTFSITVALNDYKWNNVKTSDNNFITSGIVTNNAATPFDTTKLSYIEDGPVLFTCDSITFRIFNTLNGAGGTGNVLRRVYIKDLTTGNIIWDNTFKPSSYPGSTSPSVHLKINTNYRFYFDDLCNDVDSADRNYNYNNSNNYTINARPVKTCSGALMNITHPSDWNSLNKYNSPIDTITIISSSVAGDTLVGKQLVQNYQDYSLSNGSGGQSTQPLQIRGITVGATYIVQIKTLCSVYNDTVTMIAPSAFSANVNVNDQACKLNTAEININYVNLPATAGYIKYSITSGPSSFTDTTGTVFTITYPIQDSAAVGNAGGQANVYIKGLSTGTYSINITDQCGDVVTKTIIISSTSVAKISGTVTVNQQCPGASSITFNGTYQHIAGQLLLLKQTGSTYTNVGGSSVNANTSAFAPSYTFSGLADGVYEIVLVPITTANTNILSDCDTLYNQFVTLQYQLPVLDTAYGFVCTAGGSDGKVTLYGKNGARPYQFQMINASGTALTAYQTDSTFTGLTAGLYRFRMLDNCGNAVTYSYQLDTLKNPVISVSTNCPTPGGSLTLTADSIYNASYVWSFTPTSGGSSSVISSGRILNINPLTPANYGTYTVTYSISGCSTAKTSKVTVGNCTVILPVNLKYFNARVINCKTELSWQSATEIDFSKYVVEYSTNGIDFTTIGTIIPKGDNSYYTYSYQASQQGKSYYRLKVIETDGSISYSKTLYLNENCNGTSIITAYPNPAKDMVIITGLSGNSSIQLKSLLGQALITIKTINTTYEIDLSKYPKGAYMLQVIEDNGTEQTIKLEKE